jgi:AcrR family transcriptional regulator
MADTTREQLLQAATTLFASKGFYGASLANIADELQLTKQALLHHFGRKEQLYAEVLKRICDHTMASLATPDNSASAEEALRNAFLQLYTSMMANTAETQVLMRELLDNERRATEAKNWYLKPLLDQLLALARELPSHQREDETRTLAGVYQLLGAINYFAVSKPTLTQMFGESEYQQMRDAYTEQLQILIQHFIEN